MTVSPTTGLTPTALPQTAVTASPLDGTSPSLATAALTGQAGAAGYGVPTLTGAGVPGSTPQTNATNQTALAQNGDVNQTVTNQNQYTNKYYNIIVPNSVFGGVGNLGNLGGMFGSNAGNAFIDPQTGVLYVQKDNGVLGWFKRLFSGGY